MTDERNDHTDAEIERRIHSHEMGEPSPADQAWERWTSRVEKLLGIETLDGDQLQDGYSLDFANEAFDDGHTPEQYATRVRNNQAALADRT